jgi:DNA repair photolyase
METNKLFGDWKAPATITPNNFVYKSLSNWALNVAVGCRHGCGFCFVPKVSTIKLLGSPDAPGPLAALGVKDADQQWGEYVYVRPWDEKAFRNSLRAAENTPREKLKPDGNRAVILCSTTDAYQVIPDPEMNKRLEAVVRNSLKMILEESTLNVRILTRGPLAKRDFALMREFGKRLVFGMSLPTLNDKLARVYEQNAGTVSTP